MASRVVPDSGATTLPRSPSSRFTMLDFPTLGRPTTATWITSSSSAPASCGGSRAKARPRRAPAPFPAPADTGNGSPPLYRQGALRASRGGEGIGAGGGPAARVHQPEVPAVPRGRGELTVPGYPRPVVRDGTPSARQAVEERGFPG